MQVTANSIVAEQLMLDFCTHNCKHISFALSCSTLNSDALPQLPLATCQYHCCMSVHTSPYTTLSQVDTGIHYTSGDSSTLLDSILILANLVILYCFLGGTADLTASLSSLCT
jgi:hypothetical protein